MAITQATSLADFSTGIGTAGAVLQVDNADGRVGIGTTDPQADLQVGIAITMDGNAGVITASSFTGDVTGTASLASNLTGSPNISVGTITATGNVSVGGTLTYEDVTNIDAVGVVTARTGVKVTAGGVDVTAGGLNVTAGIATFKNEVNADGGIDVAGGVNVGAALTVGGAVNVTGVVTLQNNLDLQDNDKLLLGTGDDTEFFHSGAAGFLYNKTGHLYIDTQVSSGQINFTSDDVSKFMIKAVRDAQVELYHNGSEKLGTKSDGVNITGELECDSLDVDGDIDIHATRISYSTSNEELKFLDSIELVFGNGDDLKIYHDSNNSLIKHLGTGDLYIQADNGDTLYLRPKNNEDGVKIIPDGAVELYHDNSKKIETTSDGVTVTGTVTDSIGSLRRVATNNVTGSSGNLSASDANKVHRVSSSSITLTIPQNIFTVGDMITFFNVSATNLTIAQGTGATIYNSADGTTGNRTLAAKGLATLVCTASNEFVISGSQLT